MKNIFLFTFLFTFSTTVLLGSTSFAQQVVLLEGVTAKYAEVNFDGSTTYIEPRVKVAGGQLLIGNLSHVGFCKLLNKSYVTVQTAYAPLKEGEVVQLNEKGQFADYAKPLTDEQCFYLSSVTCR